MFCVLLIGSFFSFVCVFEAGGAYSATQAGFVIFLQVPHSQELDVRRGLPSGAGWSDFCSQFELCLWRAEGTPVFYSAVLYLIPPTQSL